MTDETTIEKSAIDLPLPLDPGSAAAGVGAMRSALAARAGAATADPSAPLPTMTQAEWMYADVTLRSAALVYGTTDIEERRLRRALDERRLTQQLTTDKVQQAVADADQAHAAATAEMAAAFRAQTAGLDVSDAKPEPLAEPATLALLVAAQVLHGGAADIAAAAAQLKAIKAATTPPRPIVPAPL